MRARRSWDRLWERVAGLVHVARRPPKAVTLALAMAAAVSMQTARAHVSALPGGPEPAVPGGTAE